MTYEEAKDVLKNTYIRFSRCNGKVVFLEAIRKASASIERQIPKKPDFEGDGYDDSGNLIYDTWICPHCGDRFEVDYEVHKYCPMCGQAIDWSEAK